ncbi:MAG: molecular chaperone TorD family protein [Burkholderiales bacterium]|nr:molecular chaperone TorD family protein [Burkholderiales bacterium]
MTLYAPPTSSALDEETARAELYGVLALLYYAAPSPELITQLSAAATEAPAAEALLEEPWRVLVGMARSLPDGAIAQEFDALFGGIGKPEVYLYGSHFLSGFLNEKPLARLRTDLAALGLARDDAMSETEDHVACLCEVMRYLIAGDDVAVANLTRQREFFSQHLQPWVGRMCADIEQHPRAHFYTALAGLTRAFMDVEAQGFDMLG